MAFHTLRLYKSVAVPVTPNHFMLSVTFCHSLPHNMTQTGSRFFQMESSSLFTVQWMMPSYWDFQTFNRRLFIHIFA